MSRAIVPAAIVAGLLAFAPWGNASIQLLGEWSPALQFKGTQIDSGLGLGIQAGWIMIALAVGVVIAVGRQRSALFPAALLAAYAVYSIATLGHHHLHVVAMSTGQDVSGLSARVTVAWGSIAELVAAVLVLAGALAARREPAPVPASS